MNDWGSIIAIEVFAIVFIMLGLVVFLSWQRKKRLNHEIEQLIEAVQRGADERKQWVNQYLQTKHQLDAAQLAEISEQLLGAEKVFLQSFVKQQLEQSSLISLHLQLIELLDQYLKALPEAPPPVKIQTPQLSTSLSKQNVAALPPEQPTQDDFLEVADDDFGDSNQAEADPELKQVSALESGFEEESDWNDAFAEADGLGEAESSSSAMATVEPEPLDILAEDDFADDESDWNLAFEEAEELAKS